MNACLENGHFGTLMDKNPEENKQLGLLTGLLAFFEVQSQK